MVRHPYAGPAPAPDCALVAQLDRAPDYESGVDGDRQQHQHHHETVRPTDNDLVLVGGRVRQSDGAVVGEDAVEFISRYKVDYAVIGCSSLDEDGTILDFDAQEVSVARAILRNSRKTILVADQSKFLVTARGRDRRHLRH